MSDESTNTDDGSSGDESDVGRQVAKRVFASEFNDGTYTFKKSDDDRAPVFQLLPTGVAVNRIFICGTVTEIEDVGSDDEYLQARIVDPTGTFYVYAGQYQPEAATVLRELNGDLPAWVSVAGKPRTYETDDGEINVSIRPESISVIDQKTRDRWVFEAAEQTIDRIANFTTASDDASMAIEQYGDDHSKYRENAVTALQDLLDSSPSDTSTDSEDSEEATANQS